MNRKFIKLMLLIGVLAVSAQAEMITNGGFETGDFTGWWTYEADDPNQSVSVVSTKAYEGTYSAELVSATSVWAAELGQSPAFDLTPGDWTLSFAYNAVTPSNWGSFAYAIKYWDSDWTELSVYPWVALFQQTSAPDPNNWVEHSADYTAPANTAHAEVKFQVADWATVNIDSVSAVPEPTTIALLSLGGLIFRKRK